MKNTAKLIFSINKEPSVKEHTHAVKRRLLVIPFDRIITERDERVEDRLKTQEMSGIITILVRNLRRNLIANGGKFKIDRSSPALADAQYYFLSHGSSVVAWSTECLVAEEKAYLPVSDAYEHYQDWCKRSGMKEMNKLNFAITFNKLVLKKNQSHTVRRVDGKPARVIDGYRMKKEGEDDYARSDQKENS
jgi:putative DNA primase/helicase